MVNTIDETEKLKLKIVKFRSLETLCNILWIMELNLPTILCFVIIGCFVVIYLPCMCYGALKLWVYRHNVLIRKRYPMVTVVTVIGFLIHSIGVCFSTLFYVNQFEPYSHYLTLTRYVGETIFATCLLLRYWMLYYNIRWIDETKNQNWKQIIDPSFEDPTISKQWFLSHKRTFGNWNFMKKISFILFVIHLSLIVAIFCIFFLYVVFSVCLVFCFLFFWLYYNHRS